MTDKKNRPEWVPENASDGFTTEIVKGKDPASASDSGRKFVKTKGRSTEEYVEGIRNGNRAVLAQAITLVESNAKRHEDQAQAVINEILPHTGNSIRIGITGVPGAGKSTFIESFGSYLCEQGHRVAVLAVDPSSSITGGSILGDKTRMETLARNKNAFIRPSPSGGTLGGVNRKTRETILLCEAAGFDVILVETIGVGQSEVVVRSMVDFFLLLVLTGAGDELQGMKKGVMELADTLLINKADGENRQKAKVARGEYNRILHLLQPATKGWSSKAYTVSALYHEGMEETWKIVRRFMETTKESGVFMERRNSQTKDWIYAMIKDYLETSFFTNPSVKAQLPLLENKVVQGDLNVTMAVKELIQLFEA
ncbi:methylmalonyl Co-A mutase-associated GTPase MeaB [Bacillus sp. REN16]|uniref:methylmalonyl Co-A mutase-associated GTPase MeaB n=1 Tax=Bacillus sp. REN16 TaxID=2887296 RepID=UPI001E2B7F7C|nr:methylmalonyl Co-A mutase-associated GTPase MeaB [Bacillus sp. REN16]MCC3358725.1 methylmalonyl Co-A mutase-associated GTPase MeaB [Bacillus sp. REN16]